MPEEFNFEEYKKIALFIFNKYFKSFARYKDDLLSSAYMEMWEHRDTYILKNLSKKTCLFNFAKWGMCNFLRKVLGDKIRPKISESLCLSLNTPIDDENEELTLNDCLGEEIPFDDSLEVEFLKDACEKCKSKMKFNKNNQSSSQVIDLIIKGKYDAEISRIVGVTREQVRQIRIKYTKKLKEYLSELDYF